MTKQEQKNINLIVKSEYENIINDYRFNTPDKGERLRTCSAVVYESATAYYLRSYDTLIAWIDKESDTLYDALRLVYGYTATSAQHISKFYNEMRFAYHLSPNEIEICRYYPV